MLKIQTPRTVKFNLIATSVLFVALLSLVTIGYAVRQAQAAGPVTINVNTLVDENGTGANCSFREAAQAARSATAYGGCTAGNLVDGSSIVLTLAGTYTYDTAFSAEIELLDTSIVGTSATTTHLKNFSYILSGDIATTISGVDIVADAIATPSKTDTYVAIVGSNKTISSTTFTGNLGVIIDIDTSAQVITGITFDDVVAASAEQFLITCRDPALCSNVTVQNSTVSAISGDISIDVGQQSILRDSSFAASEGVSIFADANAVIDTLETLASAGLMLIELGEDSSIDGLDTSSSDETYSNSIDVGGNSTLSNINQSRTDGGSAYIWAYGGDPMVSVTHITQNIGDGGDARMQIDTPILENITVNGQTDSDAYIFNTTPESTFKNIAINAATIRMEVSAIDVDEISTTDVEGDGTASVNFTNSQSDAVVQHIALNDHDVSLELHGDNMTLQDGVVNTINTLMTTGENLTITRMEINGAAGTGAIVLSNTGTVVMEESEISKTGGTYNTLTNFTVRDSSFTETGGAIGGSYSGNLIVDNVLFDRNAGAFNVYGGSSSTFEVKNSEILDSGTTISGTPCILSINGFVSALIDLTTVSGGTGGCGGLIVPSGVGDLTVLDSTFTDNNAPVLFAAGVAGNVTIENVVMDNNTGGMYVIGQSSTKNISLKNVELKNSFTEHFANGPPCGIEISGFAAVSVHDVNMLNNIQPGANISYALGIEGGITYDLDNVNIDGFRTGGLSLGSNTAAITMSNVQVANSGLASTGHPGVGITAASLVADRISLTHIDGVAANINANDITLTNSNIDDNWAGINLDGENTVTLNNVSLSRNKSYNRALMIRGESTLLTNVTVSDALAAGSSIHYPAVQLLSPLTVARNVTVTNNPYGGLIIGDGSRIVEAHISNATIANNALDLANQDATQLSAGIAAVGSESDPDMTATVTLDNSLVFNNTGTNQCMTVGAATLHATNTISSDGSCAGATNNALIGNSLETVLATNSSVAPNLGFNGTGGKLKTLALKAGSTAIGTGATCAAYDARGLARVGCDLGAYQFTLTATIPASGNQPGQNPSLGAVVKDIASRVLDAITGNSQTVAAADEINAVDTSTEQSGAQPVAISDADTSDSTKTEEVHTVNFIPWIIGGIVVLAAIIGIAIAARRRHV